MGDMAMTVLETAQAAQAATSAAGGAMGFLDEVWKRVDAVRRKNLGERACLRAYYFEVVNNLEMLDIVNASRFRAEKPNSPLVKALVSRLETTMGAAILFGDEPEEGSQLFGFLKAQGRVANTGGMVRRWSGGREETVKSGSFYENILQAVSFTVVKVEILRRLTAFSDEELAMLNGVMLERRIVNIKARFGMIKEKLDGLKGIRELAR